MLFLELRTSLIMQTYLQINHHEIFITFYEPEIAILIFAMFYYECKPDEYLFYVRLQNYYDFLRQFHNI